MNLDTNTKLLIVGIVLAGIILSKIIKWYSSLEEKQKREFWIGFFSGSFSENNSSDDEEIGRYIIQYRDQVGGSWIDGPGSNNEYTAENMFDRFIRTDSRSNRRCRLVYKVNGRVKSVLSTN